MSSLIPQIRPASLVSLGCRVAVCLWSLGFVHQLHADEGGARRVLLVGIDRYARADAQAAHVTRSSSRRHWKDLKGAVNDVRALRDVLVRRFGYREQDIIVLEDEAATRQAILSAFHRHLIDPAKPGDHSLFFYAGHGSRIRNSRSTELDGKDETIVPADANAPAGEPGLVDIRDKEWDRMFTQVLDRGAWLTAIFDSCHSGSISRGAVPLSAATRFLEEDERDVAQLIGPEEPAHAAGQEPERREGALIMSAAQEDQQAKEVLRMTGATREWHGAFSLALIQSLNELPPFVAADRVFERVTARLLAEGYQQEPVLAGTASRRHAPLFGGVSIADHRRIRLNLVQAYAADDLELQGGAAIGLTVDSELALTGVATGMPEVRIRVTEVRGLVRSRARVAKGDWRRLRSGDEFEVVRLGDSQTPPLAVWVPPAVADQRPAIELARELERSAPGYHVRLVDDPAVMSPTFLVSWDGGQWRLWAGHDRPEALGKHPKAADILARVGSRARDARLFLAIPPTNSVARRLEARHLATEGVTTVATPDQADYALVGRWADKQIEYAWMSVKAGSVDEPASRRMTPLPRWSTWSKAPLMEGTCETGGLRNCLVRLAKLHYWLTVKGPPGDGRFPYRLGLKRVSDQSMIERNDLVEGTYQLVLQAEPEQVEHIRQEWGLQSRYVYVFVIDQEGRVTQLFPNVGSQERAHLLPAPQDLHRSAGTLREISLGDSGVIAVHAPYGTDTYLLITSAQSIPYLVELIEAGPVKTQSPLMRGDVDWSIDRLFLTSRPASF